MQISIDISAAQAVAQAFIEAPEIAVDELELAMGNALSYLHREAAERTPTASGVLRRAWYTEQFSAFNTVFGGVRNSLPYALPVELGTRPHFPPVDAIQNWVEVKLGLAGEEAESAALAIARKIARFGTPGFGMARYALLDGRDTVRAEFEEAAQRIVARLAAAGRGAAGAPGADGQGAGA